MKFQWPQMLWLLLALPVLTGTWVWLARRRAARPGSTWTATDVDDCLFNAMLGVILGGRIGYVLFYKPDMIWLHPMEVFQIWQGGMSFHGGLIGVTLAAFWFSRQTHVNDAQFAALAKKHVVAEPPAAQRSEYTRVSGIGWLKKKDAEDARVKAKTDTIPQQRLGDLAAAATPIGLFFGRLANFINGELWGRTAPADLLPVASMNDLVNLPRHPSQLYEALFEGLLLWLVLWLLVRRRKAFPGFAVGCYAIGYGLVRFVIEYFREPDAGMGYVLALGDPAAPTYLYSGPWNFSMGQVLCLLMVAGGVLFLVFGARASRRRLAAEAASAAAAQAAKTETRKLKKKRK